MDAAFLGLAGIIGLLSLILIGIPIGISLGSMGLIGISILIGPDSAVSFVASTAYTMTAQYVWAVFPLFIVMGNMAGAAQITTEAFNAAAKWLNKVPGGLAMATCVASGAFGACSGSTVANAAVFTPLALPQMIKKGYDKRLAVGCIAASGTFAAMIPPSLSMVIYGVITNEPVGKLLVAGIIPGILTLILYLVGIYIRVKRNPDLAPSSGESVSWKEKFISLKGTWGIILIFMLIMGGIYAGWFSPSAAGAVGASAAFCIVILRRKLTLSGLKTVFFDTGKISSTLFIILIGGAIFGRFLTLSGFAVSASNLVVGTQMPPPVILMTLLFLLLILGCFMDPPSIMIITLPIIYPIIIGLGYNGIWFGVIMTKVIEIALITPPLGFNAYVVHSASAKKVSLEDVFKGITPFLLLEIIALVILILFPQLSLFLPNLMK